MNSYFVRCYIQGLASKKHDTSVGEVNHVILASPAYLSTSSFQFPLFFLSFYPLPRHAFTHRHSLVLITASLCSKVSLILVLTQCCPVELSLFFSFFFSGSKANCICNLDIHSQTGLHSNIFFHIWSTMYNYHTLEFLPIQLSEKCYLV